MASFNYSYTYDLVPNNILVVPKFALTDNTNMQTLTNINLNRFKIPYSVAQDVFKIRFKVTYNGVPVESEHDYKRGSLENSIVGIYSFGAMGACLPTPTSESDSYIYILGINSLSTTKSNILIELNLLSVELTTMFICTIEIIHSGLEQQIIITNTGYSTLQEASTVLNSTIVDRTQTDFIKKNELISLNADAIKLIKYGTNDFVNHPDIRKAKLVFENTFTKSLDVPNWDIVNNTNILSLDDNGLYCNNSLLQYKNKAGITWYDCDEIIIDFDCKQKYLNSNQVKRIVSLTDNQNPDSTGFLYQGNNSCAIVLNNNTSVAGWISIYTSEYDWGTFDTWFHVHIIFKPDFMSLQLNDFIKTFTRPSYDRFRKFDSIYFGSIKNLSQPNNGYIKNFSLVAY